MINLESRLISVLIVMEGGGGGGVVNRCVSYVHPNMLLESRRDAPHDILHNLSVPVLVCMVYANWNLTCTIKQGSHIVCVRFQFADTNTSTIGSQVLLASTGSNALPGRGSEKGFTEDLEVSSVFPSATEVQLLLLVNMGLSKQLKECE